jgi:hypothetical protein
MGTWLQELRPYAGEPRTTTGWRLAKTGWRLLRRDRTLQGLTALLALAMGLIVAVGPFGVGESIWGSGAGIVAGTILVAFAVSLVTFTLVALSSWIDAAVDDLPLEVREALGDARECLPAVLGWGAISALAWLAGRLVNDAVSSTWPFAVLLVAWPLATFFVVPEIAVERLGAVEALRESPGLFAARWRETIGGSIGIVAFAALAAIVPAVLLTHVDAVQRGGNGIDYPLLVLAGALIVLIAAVALVSKEAMAVLLLREEYDDLPGDEYAGRRLRRRAKVGRVLGGVAIGIAMVIAAAAINRSDQKTIDWAREPGGNYTVVLSNPADVDLPSGAAVVYRGAKIGVVLGSHGEDSNLSVTFHVEPGFGPKSTPGSFQIVRSRALGPLLVLIPAPPLRGGETSPA